MNAKLQTRNRALLRKLSIVAVGMFGFGFALVPLYAKICQVTGVNQVVKADSDGVTSTQVDESRLITVEFDSNSRGDVGWVLTPLERKRQVHPGQLVHVVYELKNPTSTSISGQAIPSYGPQLAGQYVKKLDCFCFSQQEIRAGETRQLAVAFVIDPAIPVDVHTITLSYTMFEVGGTRQQVAAPGREG